MKTYSPVLDGPLDNLARGWNQTDVARAVDGAVVDDGRGEQGGFQTLVRGDGLLDHFGGLVDVGGND